MLTADELQLLAQELHSVLEGARLSKVHDLGPERFVFRFHTRAGRRALLVALEQDFPRAHLIAREAPAPARPGPLATALRTHLQGSRVRGVESLAGDRILHLRLLRAGEATSEERHLYLELFGSSRNLVATDGTGRILALLREGRAYSPNNANTPV